MHTTLQYGRQAQIKFDLPPEALVLARRGPQGEPLDDVPAAVAAALADPVEFPPLDRAVTPEDHVAVALAPGVPQAAKVIAGIVHALLAGSVQPQRITIVQTADEAQHSSRDLLAELPPEIRQHVQIAAHDANHRGQLSYLAADNEDHPIYFNRHIADADLVIPVGCLRAPHTLGYTGVSVGLYPTFAEAAAQQRFAAVGPDEEPAQLKQHEAQAKEAAWLLGAVFTVQVLPGSGEDLLAVLAGEREAVARRGEQLSGQAWGFEVPQRANLVIATIEGGSQQQTWDAVARAIFAASQAVADDGSIAICTELDAAPGPSLQRLAGERSTTATLKRIRRDRTPDALAAAELCRVLENHRVYLLSQLEEDIVESLGMAHVASGEEISRLSTRHDSCILIGNAQHAAPQAAS
jgi:nickel-dependent lactate racemase